MTLHGKVAKSTMLVSWCAYAFLQFFTVPPLTNVSESAGVIHPRRVKKASQTSKNVYFDAQGTDINPEAAERRPKTLIVPKSEVMAHILVGSVSIRV